MSATKKPKVVDLFAGCGGLSLGLEFAGFEPVFVNELNADARETYLRNRDARYSYLREPGFHSADIKEMVSSRRYATDLLARFKRDFGIDKGELDLVAGGPPCQGFSGIGHRRSYSVEKEHLPSNHLFEDMAVLVHRLQPKAFLFENVRGLLHSRWTAGGELVFEDVKQAFRSIPGYRISWSLVFAKDYGVPQNRPRVLLVGLRRDVVERHSLQVVEDDALGSKFLPQPLESDVAPDLIDLLGDLDDRRFVYGGETTAYPSEPNHEVQRWFRKAESGDTVLGKGSPLTEQVYSSHSERVIAKFTAMLKHGTIPDEFRTKKFAQRVLPSRWDNGPTITATSLADDYVHYRRPRTLTVREWARLQMFPDWYQFAGKRTTGGLRRAGNPRAGVFEREVPKYTQIGNAVPVRLAERVGQHLHKLL